MLTLAGDASPLGDTPAGVVYLLVVWGATAIAALVAVVLMMIALSRREWRRAVALASLPLAVLLASTRLHEVSLAFIDLGARASLLYMRPTYMRQVESSDLPKGDRFGVFIRGGMGGSYHAIIYDESDEIGRPPESRSAAWRERARTHGLNCPCEMSTAGGHFYVGYLFC